jgi:predicted porin
VNDKTSLTRPRQRLLAAAIAGLMAAAAAPTMAASDAEFEALKRELAEQRKLIEKLLADRETDKKAQAAAPAPAAAGGAAAVTSTPGVTIYGVLDGGYEHITNVKDNVAFSGASTSKTGSLTRMATITGTMASRLGISASKEFQPGLKGIATAEMGFNFNDGTLGQGGRLFGRQLFAGIDTNYGAFTIGRQWSMMFYAMLDSDILGPNIYAMGSMDPYLPNMRFDNSIAWRGKFDKLSLGALYSTGRSSNSGLITASSTGAPQAGTCAGQVAEASYCRGYALMAKYDDANWGVDGAIDHQFGGLGGGAAIGSPAAAAASFYNGSPVIALTGTDDYDRRETIGGYVKFGPAKIGAYWLGRTVQAATGRFRSDGKHIGASYALSEKITIDGGWNHMTNNDGSDHKDRNANLVALRGFYSIDKALVAYLQLGHIYNSTDAAYSLSVGPNVAPPVGGAQTGTMAGLRYRF